MTCIGLHNGVVATLLPIARHAAARNTIGHAAETSTNKHASETKMRMNKWDGRPSVFFIADKRRAEVDEPEIRAPSVHHPSGGRACAADAGVVGWPHAGSAVRANAVCTSDRDKSE